MDSLYDNYQQRADRIQRAARELGRLIYLHYGKDRNWNSTQAEYIIHNLTELLPDEQAVLGLERAIHDLYQIEYLRQHVLNVNDDILDGEEVYNRLQSRENKDTWQ